MVVGAMKFLSIDPGKHACGVAYWENNLLKQAQLVPSASMMQFIYCIPCDQIVIEKMEVIRRRTPKPADLIDLSLISGEFAGAAWAYHGAIVVYYTPSEWKKSLPKDVTHERLLKTLTVEEQKNIHLPKNKKKALDVLDACAIGLAHIRKNNNFAGRR